MKMMDNLLVKFLYKHSNELKGLAGSAAAITFPSLQLVDEWIRLFGASAGLIVAVFAIRKEVLLIIEKRNARKKNESI